MTLLAAILLTIIFALAVIGLVGDLIVTLVIRFRKEDSPRLRKLDELFMMFFIYGGLGGGLFFLATLVQIVWKLV